MAGLNDLEAKLRRLEERILDLEGRARAAVIDGTVSRAQVRDGQFMVRGNTLYLRDKAGFRRVADLPEGEAL